MAKGKRIPIILINSAVLLCLTIYARLTSKPEVRSNIVTARIVIPSSATFIVADDSKIDLNKFGNIDIFKKALGDKKQKVLIYKGRNNKGMSSTAIKTSSVTEQVEMISLEDAMKLCGVDHIDTLKIDIEGGEYQLIENIPDYIFDRIGSINMEFHRVSGYSLINLIQKLEQNGYELKINKKFKQIFSGTGIIIARKMR